MWFTVVFEGRGSKTRHRGPFSFTKTNRKRTLASCRLHPRLELAVSSLLLPHLAACLRLQNAENARTIRSKSSQASGRRAKTPHVRFVLCFTAQTGLRAQNPRVFIGFREAVPGPPKRPPKRLPGARASRRPPRGLQEASKSPPRRPRCVCYCVLQSKLASGLKNLRFFNGFRAPKRPQVRFLLCFTDQTCLRS